MGWIRPCLDVSVCLRTCVPQYFRTLAGLVHGWTQCPTLDVVLYEVLRVSEQ